MAERLHVPDGEWRTVDAAGFGLRVTSRDGVLLFRALDVAAAGRVFVANGSMLRGLEAEDAAYLPRDSVGLGHGRPAPFVTAEGAGKMLRRSRQPGAFIVEAWLWSVALPALPGLQAA